MGVMKTTVEIHDGLLLRARRHAKTNGQPLRAVIEEGLRRVLEESKPAKPYRLPDNAYGNPGDPWPLDDYTWPELRELIYEDRGDP